MPGKETKHTEKWDRCVKKVKDKSPDANAYAICSSSIEDAGLKKKHQKRDKMGYYSNRKKVDAKQKKNEMITNFDNFIKENYNQDIDEQYWYKLKELTDKYLEEFGERIENVQVIEQWLLENDEPIDFASGIYQEIINENPLD
jgi:hypothetical protein